MKSKLGLFEEFQKVNKVMEGQIRDLRDKESIIVEDNQNLRKRLENCE